MRNVYDFSIRPSSSALRAPSPAALIPLNFPETAWGRLQNFRFGGLPEIQLVFYRAENTERA